MSDLTNAIKTALADNYDGPYLKVLLGDAADEITELEQEREHLRILLAEYQEAMDHFQIEMLRRTGT